MILEYLENILELSACIIALLLGLFQYISVKKRGWFYMVLFCLGSLISSYYWTVYLLIMGDWPDVSPILTYTGWNIALLVMIILQMHLKSREEARFFHPLMLLPIPLNIWQLTLYLPYGSWLNNAYQVGACTVVACLSIQGICWRTGKYRKNREDQKLPLFIAVLLLTTFKFGMWTSSCFYDPIGSLYYPFSFLCSATYLLLVWALQKVYGKKTDDCNSSKARLENLLKTGCFVIVMVCALGGAALSMWMRNSLTPDLQEAASETYQVIPVVLFVFSLMIVAFAISIILVVYFSHKASESDRFREEKALAEAANAAKSDFLANMSHEIRTPVNAMMGMNEIILKASRKAGEQLPADPETIRGTFNDISVYSGNIEKAGKSLLSIIEDILDLSRIEAGKLKITEEDYILSSLLNDVSNMILFRAREKGLVFRVKVDESIPDGLHGDEVRIRQIVINLLSNALKYTRRGSVTLSVSQEKQAEGQILLVIAVRDTGIGIHEEDMDKLFHKFERMDLQQNSSIEGTGLGLAIVQQLLDLMGGSIEVTSVYGEGSTFTVAIPQRVVSSEPIGPFHQHFEMGLWETENPRVGFTAPEAHILVVDDTKMNLMVTEGLLRNTKIRVDTAASGEAAIKMAESVCYDLILMDQRMPGLDGTETMRRIRNNSANLHTPVICMTADAVSGAREKYLAAGFTDYLMKPVEGRLLEDMLLKYLPKEKVRYISADGQPDARGEKRLSSLSDTLRNAGICPGTGMHYCGGDEVFYISTMREFAKTADEKIPAIQKAYQDQDWKNYAIYVHSLKSTAMTIGAEILSRKAAQLEEAGKKADEETIRTEHPRMMEMYENVIKALRKLPEGEKKEDPPEDGIFEFTPDNQ